MEKEKAATEGFSSPPTATSNGLDEIAQFRLMMQRTQDEPSQSSSPAPQQDSAVVPAVSAAADVATPAAPSNQPPRTQQENGMSGLRRIMGGGVDPVLHSAGIVKPSLAREASPASAMEFESGLTSQGVATSTPVAPQEATMGGSSLVRNLTPDMGAGYQHSDTGSKGVLSPTSTRPAAAMGRPLHEPAIINASGDPPQGPRLFRALGGVPPAAPVNVHSQAAPEVNGRLPHDSQTLHQHQPRGFSPFDPTVSSAVDTRAPGAALADMRGRIVPGSAEHSHALDAFGAGLPDRMNTSPAGASTAASSTDGPLSPGNQAGIGPKGSRFARFFAQQPLSSAAPSPQTAMPHQQLMQHSPQQQQQQQQQQQLAAAQQAYLRQEAAAANMSARSPGSDNHMQDLLSMLQQSTQHTARQPPAQLQQPITLQVNFFLCNIHCH